jgi:hypothetical protein
MGYNYKSVEPVEGNSIIPRNFFKEDALLKVKKMLIENNEIKETNSKLEESYKKFEEATKRCKDNVYSIYYAACTKEREVNNAVSAFQRYLDLAENDKEIALNFFNKAYNDEVPDIKNAALLKLGITQKVEE